MKQEIFGNIITPYHSKKIILDVYDLDGGGHGPAQFKGRTTDDREVFCRYKYGNLSVMVGNIPKVDCLRNGTEIFNEKVGPDSDHQMILGQVCNIAGITIDGVMPPIDSGLDEVERYHDIELTGMPNDLTGAVSYYSAEIVLSREALHNLPSTLMENFSSILFADFPGSPKITETEYLQEISNTKTLTDQFSRRIDKWYFFLGKLPEESDLKRANNQMTGRVVDKQFPDFLMFTVFSTKSSDTYTVSFKCRFLTDDFLHVNSVYKFDSLISEYAQ